ncbi:lysosomal acid glucosylceramidase [Nerophis ophidion]|uniref:lysosomal acid glucosylceramidase n=1 Tax=Nerophis ophidion TaxID=159077 RepID=UPI002AE0957B|nr:lysosomal acid glucosylceramidase [Nerophis ophidion]
MCLPLLSAVLLAAASYITTTSSSSGNTCVSRSFGHDSVVCECNSTFCDSVGAVVLPAGGHYAAYLSSRQGSRLQASQAPVRLNSTGGLRLTLLPDKKYQKIRGFGGALTDAAAINILSLSAGAQDQLLRQYFSTEGIGYSVVRVPMASCDFSTRLYTYADTVGDYNLDNFTLTPEDVNMKIPLLRRAQAMSPGPLSLLASAWSAPAWMKTNGALIGKGSLKGRPGGKEHKTWAQYYIRFLEEYSKYNLTFWAVTTGNEPTAGLMTNYSFQALGFTPEEQRDWVALDLGPAIHASSFPHTHVLLMDDNRQLLPYWAKVVLGDIHAGRYIHGVAVHWYMDSFFPAAPTLGATHALYPEYYLFGTEACAGWTALDRGVMLGSWRRAEQYAHDILDDLNHHVTGWTDWNLALDQTGGPNWVKNFVDSPIIVDAQRDVFFKQPTFYSMAHFSKFLHEGSQRVGVSPSGETGLEFSAFIRPDGAVVFIVLNRSSADVPFEVWDQTVGYVPSTAPPHSLLTLAWYTQGFNL